MGIRFHPDPGTILICDYKGLAAPEMVKTRPVIIVSPRARHHDLVTVVPISTTAPNIVLPWHYQLELAEALSPKWQARTVWIKCDMLNTFSRSRLDRFHQRIEDTRKYYDRRVLDKDLHAIRQSIAAFLNF